MKILKDFIGGNPVKKIINSQQEILEEILASRFELLVIIIKMDLKKQLKKINCPTLFAYLVS